MINAKLSTEKKTRNQVYSFEINNEVFKAYYSVGKNSSLRITQNEIEIGKIDEKKTKFEFTAGSLKIVAWIDDGFSLASLLYKIKGIGIEVDGVPIQHTLAAPETHIKYGRIGLWVLLLFLGIYSLASYSDAFEDDDPAIIAVIASAIYLIPFIITLIGIITYKSLTSFAIITGIVFTIQELLKLPGSLDFGSIYIDCIMLYPRMIVLYALCNALKWKRKQEELPLTTGYKWALLLVAALVAGAFYSNQTVETYRKTKYENSDKKAKYEAANFSFFTDPRDEQAYKYVKIGEQIWMAENLNYKIYDSKCYNNESSNCTQYGRLYYRNSAKKVCPVGWHLPTYEEWNILRERVGDKGLFDDNGFSAQLGGKIVSRGKGGISYGGIGKEGGLWMKAGRIRFYDGSWRKEEDYELLGSYGLSVRCIKEN